MAATQKPSARYKGARPPIAGAYSQPRFTLPGLSNMPKKAMGRKPRNLGSFPKLNK